MKRRKFLKNLGLSTGALALVALPTKDKKVINVTSANEMNRFLEEFHLLMRKYGICIDGLSNGKYINTISFMVNRGTNRGDVFLVSVPTRYKKEI